MSSSLLITAFSARVCRQPIDGMYVVPSARDQFRWFGLLFIRRGVFGGGIFRFNIRIPHDFPNTTSLPVVKFDLFIFHPNIDPFHRRPDLTRYFPDGWKKDKHHIQNVLLVVQRLFFSFDFEPDSCANPSAAITWREDKEKFRSMAKTCVNQSRMEVYDEPDDAKYLAKQCEDSRCHRLMTDVKTYPAAVPWCLQREWALLF
ncbi:unnamed protein product [Heligmosomoides polygyrus]|uniref:UBIQUITIN_CONJUGAT_2 domain-containing protein n=1 Tax=Heligmosomoides polygyrus TaxID=6339 RepID=A0A183F3K5_HELPZ|nr:unnamed protein product [Heligmosomoides polygyrus]